MLLPTDYNKLLLEWKGPFKVVDRPSRNSYKLGINGKTKTFHANLLKQYVERMEESKQPVPETSECDIDGASFVEVCSAIIYERDDSDHDNDEPDYSTHSASILLPEAK